MEEIATHKRVLIISHNAMSNEDNGGRTISELFRGWGEENISQLYFRKGTPAFEVCTNFFCVNDFDMIQSVIKRKEVGNIVFENNENQTLTEKERQIYGKGTKRGEIGVFGRNLLWKTGHWKSKALFEWVEKFQPQVIFLVAGKYTFCHKIAIFLAKKYHIPIVTFWGDDYYFGWEAKGPLSFWNKTGFKRSFKKLLEMGTYVTASPQMERDYKARFGKSGVCILTPSSVKPCSDIIKKTESTFVISYVGTVGYQRYESLIEVAKALRELPIQIEFNVYANEKRQWLVSDLLHTEGLNFKGGISYSEVLEVMNHSNLLLHVESFDKKMIRQIKYSMSTKIADYLTCGTPMIGYGPRNVSCMDYIANNGIAYAENVADLKEIVYKFYSDENFTEHMVEVQKSLAKKNHNLITNRSYLNKIILESGADESITNQ